MKKLFLYFLLFPLVILSQSNIYSGGVEFSDEYGSAYKVGYERLFYEKLKKSYSIGFEFGQSFAALSGDNMTGYIGFNEYPEDFTGDYKKTVLTPSVKFGYEISNSFFLSLNAGLNFVKEYGVFNDSFGNYYIETGEKLNNTYYKVSLELITSFVNPRIGFGSNGIFIGLSFLSNKKGLEKYFNDKKQINQSKRISIGGESIYDINLYDLRAMIDVFLDDCKQNDINVENNQVQASFVQLDNPIIAIAEGMNIDGMIIIKVDPIRWKNASPSKKWYIIYHELGHDVLNLEHGEGGKMMFNMADREYSWDEFYEDKEYMLKSFSKYKN